MPTRSPVTLVLGLLLGWAVSAGPSMGQVGLTRARFQTIQPNPFVQALGNATVAARGYPGAVGVNPATIGRAGLVSTSSNVQLRNGPLFSSPWPLGLRFVEELWVTAPSVSVKRGGWAGAFQIKHFSLGTIEVRNSEGESLGEINQFEQSIKVAVARDLTEHVTVGTGVNLIRLRHTGTGVDDREQTTTLPTLDLGVHYERELKSEGVRLSPAAGISLTDFGPTISFEGDPNVYGAPMTARIGGALTAASTAQWRQRPAWRAGLYAAVSNRLVSGTASGREGRGAFRADGPFRALVAGWGTTRGQQTPDGVAQVGPWERLNKHVGLNLSLYDLLSVRVGRYHEDEDNGARQYTSLGFGLDAYYLALDVSWVPNDEKSPQRVGYGRLTVRVPLTRHPRNFWPDLLE